MGIEIEIPKEFEEDFKHDRFEECLTRLNADAHMVAGNYEKETAIMLIKAFKDSKPAYDVDAVTEQLGNYLFEKYCIDGDFEIKKIVKGGGVHETD